jgi:V/A-type H+-transporting ATPase subunit I
VLGISAALFGFLYGSVFGLEELIPALWHHPQADIMGTLLTAVAVGVCVVLTAMVFNIINSFRRKDWGEMLFSPNGAAGVVFYGMVLLTAARVMLLGQGVGVISVVLIVLPLILVALKEPLEKRLRGEHVKPEGGVVMYGLGLVLELVEVLLSYATNTISFIRVGAFAISHAGMMAVVLMLAKTANDTHNPLVMIIGNILVIGIEGFLVGIQVLRLDFYELFSRFYRGGGQPFTPYRQKAIHK